MLSLDDERKQEGVCRKVSGLGAPYTPASFIYLLNPIFERSLKYAGIKSVRVLS